MQHWGNSGKIPANFGRNLAKFWLFHTKNWDGRAGQVLFSPFFDYGFQKLCKGVHCVNLGGSFQTHILLQKLASIKKRTSPIKFDHLAEKSGKGSISNISTKDLPALPLQPLKKISCLDVSMKALTRSDMHFQTGMRPASETCRIGGWGGSAK